MSYRPHVQLPTHEVFNQVPNLQDYDLFGTDVVLQEAVAREGAGWAKDRLTAFGTALGSFEIQEAGRLANVHGPILRTFNRQGQRLDEVEFHPAYHQFFSLAMAHEQHSIAWTATQRGGHVAHTALGYMAGQIEAGSGCPTTMTYAVVPSLRHEPKVAAEWIPRVTRTAYDPRLIPADQKTSATIGMSMTEKQGGSDVRANTTRAVRDGDAYRLTGHKFFCSAPMCDAFLTLAQAEGGLTCFLVPRFLPDGTRNNFFVQRLKDKLGNKSNASSEIEYNHTYAERVGDEGRGVRTILEMVHHTRLDCTTAAAALGRQAFVQAAHHAVHRSAFGKRLIEQPLMRNVLADLAVEIEAQTALAMRMARAYDDSDTDPVAGQLARIGIAVSKYWTNKRCPTVVAEAMECLGGGGYVEESILPRLYREAPLNGIWEGSGNVICLDVLRALTRQPEVADALLAEIDLTRGTNAALDAAVDRLKVELRDPTNAEYRARRTTELAAVTLQASLLIRHSTQAVSDAFVSTRLGDGGYAFGTLPVGTDVGSILRRAWAAVDA